jgi:hypothetical protein
MDKKEPVNTDPRCPYCGIQSSEPTMSFHIMACSENPKNKIVKTEIVKIAVQDKELEEKAKKVIRKRK